MHVSGTCLYSPTEPTYTNCNKWNHLSPHSCNKRLYAPPPLHLKISPALHVLIYFTTVMLPGADPAFWKGGGGRRSLDLPPPLLYPRLGWERGKIKELPDSWTSEKIKSPIFLHVVFNHHSFLYSYTKSWNCIKNIHFLLNQ